MTSTISLKIVFDILEANSFVVFVLKEISWDEIPIREVFQFDLNECAT